MVITIKSGTRIVVKSFEVTLQRHPMAAFLFIRQYEFTDN
jgi:hypothetical protein